MKPLLIPIAFALLLDIAVAFGASPVMEMVKGGRGATSLLQNGNFEGAREGKLLVWQPAPKGYLLADREGRGPSRALVCEGSTNRGWFGASQTLPLNRSQIAPLRVRGWSKAENVSGSSDNDYSLYVDLVYQDGSTLWGQTANFRCGTHDWEQRDLIILPDKPVKTLTIYCLLRGHSGKAWFDDVSVEEIKAEGEAVLFQGAPMQMSKVTPGSQAKLTTLSTKDGLALGLQDNHVRSLRVEGRELAVECPSGFLARDVAANSDLYDFQDGVCAELGLKIKANFIAQPDSIAVQGRLSNTTGRDRAVMLLFALPLDARGWRWDDDIRRDRIIQGRGEFANNVVVRCGTTGTMSLYPLASVCDERSGLALGLDMAQAAQYRLTYHAGTRQFFIVYDFGLVKDSERFPSSADFRFVLFRFDPRWGFRAAFQKLTQIFPSYFAVRSKEQGIWMPFTDVAKVEGWQDFGFKYHEGNNNVSWDDGHGILSFRYTEPMTWWMPMKKDLPRTEAEALRVRDELAAAATGSQRNMALASQSAGMSDSEGKPLLRLQNAPWCDGAVWSLNPNPALPGAVNGATAHWNDAVQQKLYGPAAKGTLDGEYLDSLEGYVTADLNFRREHFRQTTVPLSFATDSKQPALYKGLAVFEFTKWFCEDVHRLGKLTFANSVPHRFTFLCPWLDVMGTETDWWQGGKYRPASDTQMSLWRTMCGQKPYLLLMNTDYDAFTPDLVEKYFQRSLFYGIFPSMFSHNAADHPYWQNPKWYNRDRALFKKYLPLVQRIAEAGWQPITGATCKDSRVFLERFGAPPQRNVYLTFFNDTAESQTGTWKIDPAVLPLTGNVTVRSLISGKTLERIGEGWGMALPPQGVEVVELEFKKGS